MNIVDIYNCAIGYYFFNMYYFSNIQRFLAQYRCIFIFLMYETSLQKIQDIKTRVISVKYYYKFLYVTKFVIYLIVSNNHFNILILQILLNKVKYYYGLARCFYLNYFYFLNIFW